MTKYIGGMEQTPPERCPKCGKGVYCGDTSTASGRVVETYFCETHCGWLDLYDRGEAFWRKLKDEPES